MVMVDGPQPRVYIWNAEATGSDDGLGVIIPVLWPVDAAGRWLLTNPRILYYSGNISPSNLADGTGETIDIVTAAGAELGDMVLVSLGADTGGILVTAWVKVAGTVSIRLQNETTGTYQIGGGAAVTARLVVIKPR
jgi:hypothetical protein